MQPGSPQVMNCMSGTARAWFLPKSSTKAVTLPRCLERATSAIHLSLFSLSYRQHIPWFKTRVYVMKKFFLNHWMDLCVIQTEKKTKKKIRKSSTPRFQNLQAALEFQLSNYRDLCSLLPQIQLTVHSTYTALIYSSLCPLSLIMKS